MRDRLENNLAENLFSEKSRESFSIYEGISKLLN